jgi:DNA-binding NarL/FixJ family response regulator
LATIRILLVGLHGLLLGIVKGVLEEQPDMAIIGELRNHDGLLQAIADTGADLVVWALDDEQPLDRHLSVFDDHPALKVIAIRDDGRQSCLWQLQPHRTVLGQVSPNLLVEAIRGSIVAMHPRGGG